MKFSFSLLSLLIILNWPKPLLAQDDHLRPVDGIFSESSFLLEYYSSVRKILLRGFSDHPEVRIVIIPSFATESALDMEQDESSKKYFLLYHLANPSIWYSQGKHKIQVDSVKIEIETHSFLLIKKLFLNALNKVKYPTDSLRSLGFDGTDYYFSVDDMGLKTGTIWSPPPGGKMSKLVEITNHLIQMMKSESDLIEFDDAFSKEITELTKKLE